MHPQVSVATCRHLYEPDGRFTDHHIQDWQHSAMYLAFMLAGYVDLMSYYTALPAGLDQVRKPPTTATQPCVNHLCMLGSVTQTTFLCPWCQRDL